jgi:replicative DNA helicase
VIHGATEALKDAYDETTDVFDVINKAEKFVSDLTKQVLVTKASTTASLYNKWLSLNEIIRKTEDGLSGVPSGFHDLDKVTGGWQKSDLIVLAGRPGMGKTAMALSLIINAAVKFKRPTAIFSLEMSEMQLMARMMAQMTGKNSQVYTRYGVKDADLPQHSFEVQDLVNAPIFIDDTPAMSLFEMRSKARKLVRDEKIELLVVDYIGIATSGEKTMNREQEVSKISGGLKALAKELNIPVIALAQLSRAVETRGGAKEPQLSDLRDSGSVEQDADMVIFIHRPEYYGINEEEGVSTIGQAALLIRKHRNGALETPIVGFDAKTTKFYDFSEQGSQQKTQELPLSELKPNKQFTIEAEEDYL